MVECTLCIASKSKRSPSREHCDMMRVPEQSFSLWRKYFVYKAICERYSKKEVDQEDWCHSKLYRHAEVIRSKKKTVDLLNAMNFLVARQKAGYVRSLQTVRPSVWDKRNLKSILGLMLFKEHTQQERWHLPLFWLSCSPFGKVLCGKCFQWINHFQG